MERKHDEKKTRGQKPQLDEPQNQQKKKKSMLIDLQHKAGNQAVQRLITQQISEGGFDLDDNTTAKIQQARSGGQSLERSLQRQMETKFGKSLDDVKLHTDQPSNTLSQQLGASAFTVGSDVFFREGKFDPGSTKGQELLAHELTHVIQQREGKVNSGTHGLSVRPAGDEFEQEADSIAQSLISEASPQPAVAPSIQRQEDWEDEIEDTSNFGNIEQALSASTAAPSQPSPHIEVEQEEAIQAPPLSQSQQETVQIEDRPAGPEPQQTSSSTQQAQQVEAEQEEATQAPPLSQSQQETAQIEDNPAETEPQQTSSSTQQAQQVEAEQEEATQALSTPQAEQETAQIEDRPAGPEPQQTSPTMQTTEQEEHENEAQANASISPSNANPFLTPSQTKVRVEAAAQEVNLAPTESQSQQETAQIEDQSEALKEKTIKKNLKKRLKDFLNNEQNAGPAKKTPIEEEIMLQPIEEEEEEELQMQSEEEEEEWEDLQMQSEEEEEWVVESEEEDEEEEAIQTQPEPEEEEEAIQA